VPDVATPVVALSLRVLRHRLHERLIGEDVDVVLQLDRLARIERDARRRGGPARASDYARGR
jgi:hypothetical protein